MIEAVFEPVFQWVCGQEPEHGWAPGGVPLPFCQRCTGLYAGAALALFLHLVFRPRRRPAFPTGLRPGLGAAAGRRLPEFYGICLLQMIPFGFHLVPQGPALRGVSGCLFSFGLVGFLWLLPASHWGWGKPEAGNRSVGLMAAGVLGCLGVVGLAVWGGRAAAALLAWAGLAGLGGLVLLVLINAGLLMGSARCGDCCSGEPPYE